MSIRDSLARALASEFLENPDSGPRAMEAIRAFAETDLPIPGVLKPWIVVAVSAWEEANKAEVNKLSRTDQSREAIRQVEYLRSMGHKRDYALARVAEEMGVNYSSLERNYKSRQTKAARVEYRRSFERTFAEAVARGDMGFTSVDELKAFLKTRT